MFWAVSCFFKHSKWVFHLKRASEREGLVLSIVTACQPQGTHWTEEETQVAAGAHNITPTALCDTQQSAGEIYMVILKKMSQYIFLNQHNMAGRMLQKL